MMFLSVVCALAALAGIAQAAAGWLCLRRFRRLPPPPAPPRAGITVLKPLYGAEPMLEAALASLCALDYAPLQIVFGAHDAADPALEVVERLRARFPGRDIAVVIDPTRHGSNGKVGNLINMLPAARHDLLVIADSGADPAHVAADLLSQAEHGPDSQARRGAGLCRGFGFFPEASGWWASPQPRRWCWWCLLTWTWRRWWPPSRTRQVGWSGRTSRPRR
jgi:ceramide glucosyltransferase